MNDSESARPRLQEAAAKAKLGLSEKLGDVWWFFLIRGVLAAVLGVCALIWPTASLEILVRVIGAWLVIDGIAGIVGSLRAEERGSFLLQAGISLVIGLVLLFWPDASVRTLFTVIGIWALVFGVCQVLGARNVDLQADERRATTTIGWVAAIVGAVLVFWPGTGVVALAWILALALFLVAALLIFLATRLKRLRARVDSIGAKDTGSAG
jgi:uncharacterized membrane protein HdeD (DUF308 family)